MANISITQLQAKKARGEKFTVITTYDATFARLVGEVGIEVILVGDSLGMVLQGHDSTLPVTVDHIAYHVASVARANSGCLVIADMPFGSYATPGQTLDNAAELMRAGAHMVKLEGGEWLAESVALLAERGIPVCGHLGLTPQSVNAFGGFKVQGRAPEQAQRIRDDAAALERAGAGLLVLECVPRALAADISRALAIPVIGIGAGAGTDAQVLVLHDMLGLSARAPKFVRNFLTGCDSVQEALANYRRAVESGEFPGAEHGFD
jgi:3-methyl-2-oxobutanoate hydroxymethyltransferase